MFAIISNLKTIASSFSSNIIFHRLKKMVMVYKRAPLVFVLRLKISILEIRVTSSSNALPPLPLFIGRAMRNLFKGLELSQPSCQRVDLVETQVKNNTISI